jgi:hypothetical protein
VTDAHGKCCCWWSSVVGKYDRHEAIVVRVDRCSQEVVVRSRTDARSAQVTVLVIVSSGASIETLT